MATYILVFITGVAVGWLLFSAASDDGSARVVPIIEFQKVTT